MVLLPLLITHGGSHEPGRRDYRSLLNGTTSANRTDRLLNLLLRLPAHLPEKHEIRSAKHEKKPKSQRAK